MKKVLMTLLFFMCAFANAQSPDLQVFAPGGVNFGNGNLLVTHSGNGAPSSSCKGVAEYIQLDATVGKNIWQCVSGTMVQQGSSGGGGGTVNAATVGQIAIYTASTAVSGINTTGTAGSVVLSDGAPQFTGSPNINTAIATSVNNLVFAESGTGNIGIGNNSVGNSISGSNNIGLGDNTQPNNNLGSENTAVGDSALEWYIQTLGDNTAVGFNAGCCYNNITSNHNTATYYSTYIGADSSPLANGDFNEIVIGYSAIGNGSNTVTIGNTSVTANFFNGVMNAGSFSGSGTGLTGTAAALNIGGNAATATTTNHVNGVLYPGSPSTNTVPVVTSTNTVTYEAIPNAALANSASTVNNTACALGASCTTYIEFSATEVAGVIAFNENANVLINTVTLNANVISSSFTSGSPSGGQQMTMIICQPSSGGPYTFSWPTNMLGTLTIGPTASTCSTQNFMYSASMSKWYSVNFGVINEH